MAKKPTRAPAGYGKLLDELKDRIRTAQVRAAVAVNSELVLLYWEIGRDIVQRFDRSGWGTKIIERLSADLKKEFPTMKGFSLRNLEYMRRFAAAWPDKAILQQAAAKIPWFHNCVILDKVKDAEKRVWYVQKTMDNGWSRNVLVHQIETDLYRRQGKAITNFAQTLPAPQSDLAQETLKDPLSFEFLTLDAKTREADLQKGLLTHLRDFLVELGVGFAFVGSNVHLDVGGDDFYLDLLFYHLKLRCFVIADLKTGAFKPEYAGKMNFYLAAVDDLLAHPDDQPSIGMILCRGRNKTVVEYSLRDMKKPIGVPEYTLTEALPRNLQDQLPTVEELEAELTTVETESAPAKKRTEN